MWKSILMLGACLADVPLNPQGHCWTLLELRDPVPHWNNAPTPTQASAKGPVQGAPHSLREGDAAGREGGLSLLPPILPPSSLPPS